MTKQYVANAYLQQHDTSLYAIFAWSHRPGEIITAKSWLIALEILAHERSLEQAYEIFQKIKLAPIAAQVKDQVNPYQALLGDAIVLVADSQITIYGKGFRSFIEKDLQREKSLPSDTGKSRSPGRSTNAMA
mgnify:CR=1 FL=1